MRLRRPGLPASTLGQIVAVIAGSMLATLLLLLSLIYLQNLQAGAPWPWAIAHRIISLVNLLEGVPPERLHSVTLLAQAQRPNLQVTVFDAAVPCQGRSAESMLMEVALRAELPHLTRMRVASCEGQDTLRNIQVLVPIGTHQVEFRTGTEGYHPLRVASPTFGALLFLLVSTLSMSAWAIWRVIHPLRRLSESMERFGRDISPLPIVEEGPTEIRNVARTLNALQQRIHGLLDDRTRMLAAVSHDLRTPLTRMKLHLELADPIEPARLHRNIDLMHAMVTSALDYLRDGNATEAPDWLDLDALLATLCDEYEESGAHIQYHGPGHLRLHGRHDALQRAFGNLVDNALQHSTEVVVRAFVQGDRTCVQVIDNGPGIPEAHLQAVLAPFFRLDASRSSREGSIGLGLAIVDGVVRAHGGELELANGEHGGLVVTVRL